MGIDAHTFANTIYMHVLTLDYSTRLDCFRFVIGSNGVQISLVTFATHPYNVFFLNAYNTSAALKAAIQRANYTGGTTHTQEALNFVRDYRLDNSLFAVAI